jgi:hypothetical protein
MEISAGKQKIRARTQAREAENGFVGSEFIREAYRVEKPPERDCFHSGKT